MINRYLSIQEKERYALHRLARSVAAGVDDPGSADIEALLEADTAGSAAVLELAGRADTVELPPLAPGLLDVKIELARRMLVECCCCERRCGVDRAAGEKGYCGVGARSRFSSEFLHMGEEPELVPSHTIFFSGCTFRCAYCQNWDIAMSADSGIPADPEVLAEALRDGISQGSRNANFVGGNPDPNLHTILETIALLGPEAGFLPMVWNSNMYTSSEAMGILTGVIDVFLGDFRYGNDDCASELSDVPGYTAVVTRNFTRAFEAAEVMVRHLVLPGHLECCTRPIMEWVSRNMPGVYFNLMFQYRPEYRAGSCPEIDRRLSGEERREALEMAGRYKLCIG